MAQSARHVDVKVAVAHCCEPCQRTFDSISVPTKRLFFVHRGHVHVRAPVPSPVEVHVERVTEPSGEHCYGHTPAACTSEARDKRQSVTVTCSMVVWIAARLYQQPSGCAMLL